MLDWLGGQLSPTAAYSVGVVVSPDSPTTDSELDVRWVLGADVLNRDPDDRTHTERRRAGAMLARRGRVRIGGDHR